MINPLSSEPLVSLSPPDGSSTTKSIPLGALPTTVFSCAFVEAGPGFDVGAVVFGPSGISEEGWFDALRGKIDANSCEAGVVGMIPSENEMLRETPPGGGGTLKS